jgi:hypothetical protein
MGLVSGLGLYLVFCAGALLAVVALTLARDLPATAAAPTTQNHPRLLKMTSRLSMKAIRRAIRRRRSRRASAPAGCSPRRGPSRGWRPESGSRDVGLAALQVQKR